MGFRNVCKGGPWWKKLKTAAWVWSMALGLSGRDLIIVNAEVSSFVKIDSRAGIFIKDHLDKIEILLKK